VHEWLQAQLERGTTRGATAILASGSVMMTDDIVAAFGP